MAEKRLAMMAESESEPTTRVRPRIDSSKNVRTFFLPASSVVGHVSLGLLRN